jgi:hypothetical protein
LIRRTVSLRAEVTGAGIRIKSPNVNVTLPCLVHEAQSRTSFYMTEDTLNGVTGSLIQSRLEGWRA